MTREHIEVIKTLARDRNWSKHKLKSIRGQILRMDSYHEREEYLKKIIKSKR